MSLKGKRAAILAENLYQEMELWVPYYRLKEEGAEVTVVGTGGAKSYASKHGYPVSVDAQVESLLRGGDGGPAFGGDEFKPLGFLRELQELAEAELPNLTLLPKPADAPVYVRKRKADWSPEDERWLPLSLLRKASQVEQVLAEVLAERVQHGDVEYQLVEINDDFCVRLRFTGLGDDQVPTLCQFVQDALHGRLHHQLAVEAVP